MKTNSLNLLTTALIGCAALFSTLSATTANIPTVLTDKIQRGSGVIDILKNTSGSNLASYLNANKALYLGVDINEEAARTESARSSGVAIEQMRLLLTTTSGDFSFSDFVTSTQAKITNSAGVAGDYYVMFGQTGSNQLTSSTSNFDISKFDDVVTLNNISFTGDILSARLEVKFLQTESSRNAGVNEDFFDFSAGFEDFAIFTPKDAQMLEAAAIGQDAAPAGVTTAEVATPLNPGTTTGGETTTTPDTGGGGVVDSGGGTTTTPDAGGGGIADGGGGGAVDPAPSAPGAPAPPLVLLFAGAGLLALYHWRGRNQVSGN